MPRHTGIRVAGTSWRMLLGVLAVALAALAIPGAAFAQEPIEPTTAQDGGDGVCDDGTCTLRDAVIEAGARDDHPTIRLKADTYALTQGQLTLDGAFTIEGVGSRATTIESNGEGRVAYVATGNITVNGLTVTGGQAFAQAQDRGLGGGFRVAQGAELTLSRATVTENFAEFAGGGISTAGRLHVVQSTVSFNATGVGVDTAGRGGGIDVQSSGEAVLVNATVSFNTAFPSDQQPATGGGIHAAGAFSFEHATIAQNAATLGGGLYQASASAGAKRMWNTLLAENSDQACGGAAELIEESHNLADDASCELNEAGDLPSAVAGLRSLDDYGGPTDTHAIGIESAAIDAATADHCPREDQRNVPRPASLPCDIGAVERRPSPAVNTTLDGDDGVCAPAPDDCTVREALEDSERDSMIFLGEGEYQVTLGELQLRGSRSIVGQTARSTTIKASGAHRVLSVLDGVSSVSGVQITGGEVAQSGALGGGILVFEDAFLSVVESAVVGNRAAAGGGGIANLGGVVVASSTIASNHATTGQGAGGGLWMGFQAPSALVNSTVSGNTASGAGGGIANLGGFLNTQNVTIADNQAPTGSGVYGDAVQVDLSFYLGETELMNTIVATEAGGACAWEPHHDRVVTNSLAVDDSCFAPGAGNLVEADAGIGPLDGGFGTTDVHALFTGSPAIDAGDDEFCPLSDQRGAPRIQGAHCDIGAFEGSVAATTLRVVTQVLDGPAQPAGFTVRVYSGGEEVDSSPGSASGASFALEPGVYQVRVTGPDGYVRAFSDACDPGGEVVLEADDELTCTVTLDHVPTPPDATCLDYPHFEGATGLNLLGDAGFTDDVVLLNPASGGVGAAWYGARRPVAAGFTADFTFRITPPGGGADGLAFVVQNQGIDQLGVSGGGMGYQGLPNSLAVEFDTFPNFENGDPGQDHVAVQSLGTAANHAGQSATLGLAVLPSFKDGEAHAVRVLYEPGTLNVFVDDMVTPALVVPVDLSKLLALDNGTAFAGFTAATGGFVEGHQIGSWRLCSVPRPATLNVTTQVVNDNGGTKNPGDFSVHVLSGGTGVPGSPRAGSGTAYALAAGTYAVVPDPVAGYGVSVGGDCAGDGTVALAPAQARSCTVTANDVAPQSSGPPPDEELPPPDAGKEVNALPKSGTVKVKVAGTNRFVELEEGQQIPVGSVVDTTKGRVTIVAAGNQSADFFDGIFRLSQTKGAKPLTTLTLVEALSCPKAGKAIAAAKKKKRRLWGDGSGKFKTEGKHSAATVVGTRWLVEDRCTNTLTQVTRGKVRVRDFAKRKNVLVRAGKQYVARAKR